MRTILEHAWADLSHEVQYKGQFILPRKWHRDLSRLAAGVCSGILLWGLSQRLDPVRLIGLSSW